MAAVGGLVKNRKETGRKEKQYTKQYIKTQKHKIYNKLLSKTNIKRIV